MAPVSSLLFPNRTQVADDGGDDDAAQVEGQERDPVAHRPQRRQGDTRVHPLGEVRVFSGLRCQGRCEVDG